MNTAWIIVLAFAASVVAILYLLERVVIPWRVKRSVDRIIEDVKAGRAPKHNDYEDEVEVDNSGFQWRSLKNAKESPIRVVWADVRRVVVFKIDLLTYDEIRLRFLKADDQGVEVSEQVKGWSELTDALPRFLPGCRPLSEWIWTVTTPAFARNETQIYRRDDISSSPALKGTL